MNNVLRVLVVDDDVVDLNYTCRSIRKSFGKEVLIKKTQKSLFVPQIMATFQPDIVIIDMFLNGVTCLDVIRVVRDYHIMTPFIVVTGGDIDFMPLAKKVVPENNITDILSKPCNDIKLKVAIENALSNLNLGSREFV